MYKITKNRTKVIVSKFIFENIWLTIYNIGTQQLN